MGVSQAEMQRLAAREKHKKQVDKDLVEQEKAVSEALRGQYAGPDPTPKVTAEDLKAVEDQAAADVKAAQDQAAKDVQAAKAEVPTRTVKELEKELAEAKAKAAQ